MHSFLAHCLLFCLLLLGTAASAQKKAKKEIVLTMQLLKNDPLAAKNWKGSDSLPHIKVVIKNNTDTLTSFYEDWNSWGSHALRFELMRDDSLLTLYHYGCYGDKDFPSAELLFPGDSLVLYYNIQQCTRPSCHCFYVRKSSKFPSDNLSGATIRAVYHNKLENHDSFLAQGWEGYISLHSKHKKRFERLSKEQKHRSFVRDKLISGVHQIPFDRW